jgi:hypothetical protein
MSKWTMDNQIEEILQEFNFYKVHHVMTTLDWVWSNEDGTLSVPSVGRIKRMAKHLLIAVANRCACTKSGGFTARNDEGCLSLEFVVEDYFVEEE